MKPQAYRAFSKKDKVMYMNALPIPEEVDYASSNTKYCLLPMSKYVWLRPTGLKDKNGIAEIYECDIIDGDGNIVGNKYENEELLKNKTNLLIQDFGGKDWCDTYKKAMDRGCRYAE